jgi:hypothetical protein
MVVQGELVADLSRWIERSSREISLFWHRICINVHVLRNLLSNVDIRIFSLCYSSHLTTVFTHMYYIGTHIVRRDGLR